MEGHNNHIMMVRADFNFLSRSEAKTLELGRIASKYVYPGLTVFLSGDLGTGKTVFVRGIAEALQAHGVRSPSFTIVNEYSGIIPIAHIDLYRLPCGSFEDVDLEFYLVNKYIILIEWPEGIFKEVNDEYWHIFFSMTESDLGSQPDKVNSRTISFRACGRRAVAQLRSFIKNISSEVLLQ